MSQLFNYYSSRSRQARLHAAFSGIFRIVVVVVVVTCIGLGGWLLWQRVPAGWFLLGLAVSLLTPLLWDERFLKHLPQGKGTQLDDRLEVDVLAKLPYTLDRAGLVAAITRVRSGQFMMVRAGVSPAFMHDEFNEAHLTEAWSRVLEQRPEGSVNAADLLAGIVAVDPRLQALLPHLQLDQHDIDLVAAWYRHLDELIAFHSAPHMTGGIGRDWNFGYSHLLERFGVNVSEKVASGNLTVDIEAHQDAVEFMINTLSTSGTKNVALVGPTGSGKTTIIEGFAERLMRGDRTVPKTLRYLQVIKLDAASLLSAASGRGQLEQLVNDVLVEAYRAKNIIVCLEDAELFFEEGVGSVDLTNLLRPILEGGVVKIILTMDEQRFLKISKRNPALTQTLNRHSIAPASYDETMRVMQDQLIPTEFHRKVSYMYQALREAYRLSERYIHDVSQPGKALQLLLSSSNYAEDSLVTAASVQTAVERDFGVKVGGNVQAAEKDTLLNLEQLIHQRMINQTRAVSVVSNALRRARAGVRNEKRPIGTFLFLGPTGVGKTELAKAIADVYFEGADHLLRLDMNEFVSPEDVKRLIADGADDPHSLSAQVMKQPFSVVLLDEIEKAHDSVLSTLLQVLDEGVLRDIRGHEVSFRDTIICATSNAGSEQIRHHIEAGEELEQFEQELQSELINSKEFRPEFLNRFDEVVLFRPLTQMELAKVVDLILTDLNKTLEPQKIRVEIDTELKAWLVVKGNDPRLGARPMRRMVQRVVENVLAKRLLAGEIQAGETLTLTQADIPAEVKN